jgi:hydroxyacylglutathione hydrolase
VKELAPDVWQLVGPFAAANVYLIGDVLVDAGAPWDASTILRALRGRKPSAHALTHAHLDHMGSSRRVCTELGLPFCVGEGDVALAEDPAVFTKQLVGVRTPVSDVLMRLASGGGHPVDRVLHEGDEIAGFEVLEVPGHTAGHLAFWRESDRVLIAGDVLWNLDFPGGWPGLIEPLFLVNADNDAVHRSARRIAELEPHLALFGHGPPLQDRSRLDRFVAQTAQAAASSRLRQ